MKGRGTRARKETAHVTVSAEENIADFIKAVVLQNSFNAWKSLHDDDSNLSVYQFLIDLSKDLYRMGNKWLIRSNYMVYSLPASSDPS